MDFFTVSSYFTGIASALFAIFVILKNPKGSINKVFFVFASSVALWAVGIATEITSSNAKYAEMWLRVFHVGVCLIPITFYHFSLHVIQLAERHKVSLWIGYGIACMFIFLIPTDLFISGVQKVIQFPYYLKPGPFYHVFMLYFVTFPSMAEWKLLAMQRHLKGNRKQQAKYVFIAGLIGFIGGLTSYLPAYNIEVYPWMNSFVFFYVLIMATSVLKHQLMDIEVIIKRTLVFAGLTSFALAVFSSITFLTQYLLSNYVGQGGRLLSLFASVFLIVLGYEPLRNFLINLTDRYLFQKKINYRKLLKEATEYLAHLKSLKWQARRIVAFLFYKARISEVSLYAYQSFAHNSLVLQASLPRIKTKVHKTIPFFHSLVDYFKTHRGPLELRSIEEAKAAEKDHATMEKLQNIIQLFKDHRAEAAIPCFGSDVAELARRTELHLRGILFLGHPKSDQPYSEEDLDFFFTLGQESSIAFENARLYDEAVNRAIELAKANKELNDTNKKLKETHAALIEEKKRAVLAGIGESVAHEIRNPISPINAYLHFGRKRLEEMKNIYESNLPKVGGRDHQTFLKDFGSVMEQLTGIEQCKDRIQGIVNTLFHLVAEKTENKVEVKVDMVAASAIEEVKYQTYWETLSQPEIKNNIPRQLPFAWGIPQDIQGVFVNLIVNALHALEKTVDKKIIFDGMVDPDDPDMVRIEFSDNGCGMTQEIQDKCFEHGYTTKGAKGTGLGLFYCKHIIEEVHKGRISVKSQMGVGTRFTILLPRFKKQAN